MEHLEAPLSAPEPVPFQRRRTPQLERKELRKFTTCSAQSSGCLSAASMTAVPAHG